MELLVITHNSGEEHSCYQWIFTAFFRKPFAWRKQHPTEPGNAHSLRWHGKNENDTVKSENDTVHDTVFSLLRQNKNITGTEIVERLNMSLSTVKRKIKDLKEQGIIKRIGSDKRGYWKIIEKWNQPMHLVAYLHFENAQSQQKKARELPN